MIARLVNTDTKKKKKNQFSNKILIKKLNLSVFYGSNK